MTDPQFYYLVVLIFVGFIAQNLDTTRRLDKIDKAIEEIKR